ncbi:aminoglycoside phosphotransferase family protein [Kitasatospora sp. NPDC057223]|uniref:aminoglycoside phosphotransferase family protein n=1 Tax=Kitasatospora sp. NPDC057223 TaxID=3346055 RepID=UPI003624E493
MNATTVLPPNVERLLLAVVGRRAVLAVHVLSRAGEPVVWEVQDNGGARWFAKRHQNALMHRREVDGYRMLAPALGPGRAPRLRGQDPDGLLIVTDALAGASVRTASLARPALVEAYRQAGEIAARIHTHPLPSGPAPKRSDWAEERKRALALARGLGLPGEDLDALADATRTPPPQLPLAWCHGDFGPRNWIAQPGPDGPRIAVIDFERSCVEEPVRRDLMRILYQITPGDPGLRAAFLAGYGRPLLQEELAACRAWAAIDCPSAMRWALDHGGDPEILGYANTALSLVRDPNPVA